MVGCKSNEPETFMSNKERPVWTAPTVSDITTSMTAVVKVDLAAQYPDQAAGFVPDCTDILAAFSGESCLGIAKYDEEAKLFFLYIAGPTTNDKAVTLRYYATRYKNLFEAPKAFTFKNDDRLGTTAEPFIPAFVVVK